jgi:hypothetical protein
LPEQLLSGPSPTELVTNKLLKVKSSKDPTGYDPRACSVTSKNDILKKENESVKRGNMNLLEKCESLQGIEKKKQRILRTSGR